jgi:gluconokinase
MHSTLSPILRRWRLDIHSQMTIELPGWRGSPNGSTSALDAQENGLITCSALKRSYRDVINRRGSGVVFVFLAGSRETIAARLAARHGHFMPSSLLDSQFADLEEPTSDEPEIRVDVGPAPGVIAQGILVELGLNN